MPVKNAGKEKLDASKEKVRKQLREKVRKKARKNAGKKKARKKQMPVKKTSQAHQNWRQGYTCEHLL